MLTNPGAPERQRDRGFEHVTVEQPQPRLLRFPDVRVRTGLSRSTIWRLERQGQFPRHRRVSSNVVAWLESEVSEWIRSRLGETAG